MLIRRYKTIHLIASLIYLLGLTVSHASYAAEPDNIVYGDIIFEGKGATQEMLSPYFPHWKHRVLYRCSVCHEKIFTMERGANKMSMNLFKEGKFCGECHNGKEAFKIGFNTCNRCHSKTTSTESKP